jgi:TolB-like protein
MQVGTATAEITDVRAQLARILASPAFSGSERHRNFLSFIVEETLQGREDRLKAYTIATSAFGRGEDFDPQQDSIVRIEAGRLRRALEHFYLTEGRDDRIRISIPKGSYVPQFLVGASERPGPAPQINSEPVAAVERRGPRILVGRFEQDGGTDHLSSLGRGLARQIIMGLTRFSEIFVYGSESVEKTGDTHDMARLAADLGVDFVLSGTVTVTQDRFKIAVLLEELPQHRFVWTDSLERPLRPDEVRGLCSDFADTVARKLAQPYGILFCRALDTEGGAAERLSSYRAVLMFHKYRHNFDKSLFEGARLDLEAAIVRDTHFAEAYACLSQIYTHAARFGLEVGRMMPDPLDRALQLARTAIQLAPASSSAFHALGLALWFSGDMTESFAAYETAASLNPNDTDIMADLGLRYAMRMDWGRAVPLIETSYIRNPAQPSDYRIGLFLYHFAEGRHTDALTQARMIASRDVVYGLLAVAAAAANLGRMTEAQAAVAQIERRQPGYGRRMQSDLAARNLHPDLIDALTSALHMAGFPGPFRGARSFQPQTRRKLQAP